MASLEIPEVSSARLSARSALEGEAIRVQFFGSADLEARSLLESLLTRLHSEAQRLHAAEVTIDWRSFEFMSSGCFKSFVSWLGAVQDADADQQYRIRFLSNPSMLWQRRSLHALKCFAIDLIRIEP